MREAVVWFLTVLGLILLIFIILLALAIFCYSRIKITVKSFCASPDFKLKPASVVGSVVGVITGNFVAAAGGFVNGVRLDAQLTYLNEGFIPLYIPDVKHTISIAEQRCAVRTNAMWLKPRGSKSVPINATVTTSAIPQVVIAGLAHKGNINIEIRSRVSFGRFSYLQITSVTTKISDYLPKIGRGNKKAAP